MPTEIKHNSNSAKYYVKHCDEHLYRLSISFSQEMCITLSYAYKIWLCI